MFPAIPIIYFLLCGITGLILWYKMLGILENKGQKVNAVFVTPTQFIVFLRLLKKETNPSVKKKYLIIFWTQILIIPFFIIGEFLLISLTA
ncbi:MAG: hypothetical protein RBS07_18360 [Lentimicrobium sp.]|jgi:hypothetical protein|nr:hypothetical protein [Lentimicrobium sp.]